MDSGLGVLFFVVIFGSVTCEETTFDKEYLTVVTESTLSASDKTEYADPTNCGSKLYNTTRESNKNLALNIRVTDFAQATYFRAHPTFTACLQKVFTKAYSLTSQRIKIEQGYLPKSTATGSYTDTDEVNYISSGCGAFLKYKSGSHDLSKIAEAALAVCPMLFEEVQRDIGLRLLGDSVFIFMVGDIQVGRQIFWISRSDADVDSYINLGLVPLKTPDCSSFTELNQGDHFPADSPDAASAVGEVDESITVSMNTDFRRLVQYLGTDVDFEDTEGIGCSTRYVANEVNSRCDDRVMSARMYNVIVRLKQFVANHASLTGKIRIDEAWDDGTDNPNTLHTEGRAVKLTYPSGNTAANLKIISQLAICAKADYVSHEVGHLFLAVKKQKGRTESTVAFSQATLVTVEPPSSKSSIYALPAIMADEEDEYPLMDSSGRLDMKLNDNATLSMFVSKYYRYFRLHPAIVRCYSKLVYHENKHLQDYDPRVEVEIVHAFMTEEESSIQPGDMKYNTHTLGQALELRYSNTTENRTLEQLLKNIIDVCANEFDTDDSNMKLGWLPTSIFVAMDNEFSFWAQQKESIPSGYTEETYEAHLDERRTHALMGRIMDPDNLDEVCNKPDVPAKQRIDYLYTEPAVVDRKRRRRRQTSNQCVPTESTDFCAATTAERQKVVDDVWKEINKKHIYHDPSNEVLTALEGCLKDCGTCLEGDIWERKVASCNNFVHWVPFDFLNTDADVTNFFSRDNDVTMDLACRAGRHCINHAPLYAQIADKARKLYRPDPERGIQEALYPQEENPSPLLSIVEVTYAMHATGKVNFWVKDDTEMTSMKEPLRGAMVFNKAVTTIDIYVEDEMSKSAVQGVVEGFIQEWNSQECPTYTREILAPFTINDITEATRRRRSIDGNQYKSFVLGSLNPDSYFVNQAP